MAEDVDAELVYIDQAKHEVGMLLDPAGGIYMKFSCGGEPVEARGPFLSPVGEINKVANSFSAILERNGTQQIPQEYENSNGEKRQAIPTGKRESSPSWEASAVALGFEILTAAPLEIKAINSAEIEAKQRQEDEAAAAKKHQAEEAAAKKRQEDEVAKAAAAKKLQEEQAAKRAAKRHQRERAQAKKRAQRRSKALKQCRKVNSGKKRTRCEKRVKNKYRAPKPHSMRAARF